MNITLIVCTYNQCETLAETLAEIAKSQLPGHVTWEVLVVDSNSDDYTRDVVEGFIRRYPGRFRYIFESRPGTARALNAGVKQAHGDVIAFTDADLKLEPKWLWNLTSNLQGEQWAGTGGRILPQAPFSRPEWASLADPRVGDPPYRIFDRGDKPGKLEQAPRSGNMAFRKAMFEKYGGFQTQLGQRPSDHSQEDTEFGYRLMAAGERLVYEPSAVVRRPTMLGRLDKQDFLRWWFNRGQSKVQNWGKRRRIFGIPRHCVSIANRIVRLLPMATLRWVRALNPAVRFKRKCQVWMLAGETVESFCRLRDTTLDRYRNATALLSSRVRYHQPSSGPAGKLSETSRPIPDARIPSANIDTSRRKPLFSIVIPTRDRASMLQRAVSSVYRQSLEDFELIVIDDGSREPCGGLPQDSRLRIIRNQSSLGVAEARNLGVRAAEGTYISFLDDDDEYLPSFLSSTYSSLKSSPDGVGISWCWVKFIDYPSGAGGAPKARVKQFANHKCWERLLTDFLTIGTGYGVTLTAKCLNRVGPFNKALKVGEDTEMFYRILANGFRPVVVPGVHVVCHNHHGTKLSSVAMHEERIQALEWIWMEYSDFLFENPFIRNGFRGYLDSLKENGSQGDFVQTLSIAPDRSPRVDVENLALPQ
jgi:glycosyltransferase involved in cell wall biosynthesis